MEARDVVLIRFPVTPAASFNQKLRNFTPLENFNEIEGK